MLVGLSANEGPIAPVDARGPRIAFNAFQSATFERVDSLYFADGIFVGGSQLVRGFNTTVNLPNAEGWLVARNVTVAQVPLPAGGALVLSGLAVFGGLKRLRRRPA